MDYLRLYVRICRRALSRLVPDCYTELHHVFPESVFGRNGFTVALTAKEHLLVHHLAWRAARRRYGADHHRTKKLAFAFNQMTWNPWGRRHTSRSFIYARLAMAEAVRGSVMSEEGRLKIRLSKLGRSRPDMVGKKYMGADDETIDRIRIASRRRRGKINYPKVRKPSGPCPEAKRELISDVRKQTMSRVAAMDIDLFWDRVSSMKPFTKRGSRNSNVCSYLIAKGIDVDGYYKRLDGLD